MNITGYYEIDPSEVDPSKLFFTVIAAAKKHGYLDEKELQYVDAEVNKLLSDAVKTAGKNYIRPEMAKELLEGVFRVIDCGFSSDNTAEIIDAVRNRSLGEYTLKGMRKCGADLLRMREYVYHLEHLNYRFPAFGMEFILKMKSELVYTDIYRAGGQGTAFLQSFLGLSTPIKLSEAASRLAVLTGICDMVTRLMPSEVQSASIRKGLTVGLSDTVYSYDLLRSIAISALFACFYRAESLFVPVARYNDVADDLSELTRQELSEMLCDYIKIFMNHYGLKATARRDAPTEIERLYADVICDEYISAVSIAEDLADLAKTAVENGALPEKTVFFD